MNKQINLKKMKQLLNDSDVVSYKERSQEELIELRNFNLNQIKEIKDEFPNSDNKDVEEFIKLAEDEVNELNSYILEYIK